MVSAIQPTHDPPVRIHALGRFLVTTPDAPEGVRTRSRSKPLELLKLLVAQGGEGLAVQQAVDTLWPDADGDRAQWAFATTVRRLRGLVGGETVPLHSGQLSLCRERCWLDARVLAANLDACVAALEAGQTQHAEGLLREALELYQGPLLAGESETPLALAARERLHGALLRQVADVGERVQDEGGVERAIALYLRALEAAPATEWLYQALLRCLPRAGRYSEALAVYERCRSDLHAHLGAQPAPVTEGLRRALDAAPSGARREKPSLAVAPFESQRPEDAYFAGGIVYDLRTVLQKIGGLVVYGRPVVPGADGPHGAAGTVPARYVLGGSVRRLDRRVRITVSLTETATGRQVWGERHDRPDEDLHSMVDEIVEEIVTGLRVELVEGEQARLWARALRNPQARESFYRGLELFWSMTPEGLARSRERFCEVAELEPESTMGYGYIAWTHLFELFLGYSTDLARSRALAADYCERALAIDVDGLTLHSLRSHLHLLDGEGEAAIACVEEALRLRPSCGLTYAFYAHALLYLERPREVVAKAQIAMRLSPQPPPWLFEVLGWGHLCSGFHEPAAEAARNALHDDPTRVEGQLLLAAALHALGRTADAQACLEGLRRRHPAFDLAAFVAAKPCRGPALLGRALAWVERSLG